MQIEFPFPLTIKAIRSARRMRLRVLPTGEVTVTCHPFTPRFAINAFVQEHRQWIEARLGEIEREQRTLTDRPKSLLFRGQEYLFKLQVATDSKEGVEITGKDVVVKARKEDHKYLRALLERWFRVQAKEYFENRVRLLCDVVDREVVRVTVRSQRTRWGSCSSRNTISLNWRLILTPDWVSDYVIYHELAHLTHMNHSARFWKLVEDYYPQYKKAEKWLKENNKLLQF